MTGCGTGVAVGHDDAVSVAARLMERAGPVHRANPGHILLPPVHEIQEGPTVGDGVWIALESCDPSRPIWLGQRITD